MCEFPVLGHEAGEYFYGCKICSLVDLRASHWISDVCLWDAITLRWKVTVRCCETEVNQSLFFFLFLYILLFYVSLLFIFLLYLCPSNIRLQCLSTTTWCWWREKMSQAGVTCFRVPFTSDSCDSRTVSKHAHTSHPSLDLSGCKQTSDCGRRSVGFIICVAVLQMWQHLSQCCHQKLNPTLQQFFLFSS